MIPSKKGPTPIYFLNLGEECELTDSKLAEDGDPHSPNVFHTLQEKLWGCFQVEVFWPLWYLGVYLRNTHLKHVPSFPVSLFFIYLYFSHSHRYDFFLEIPDFSFMTFYCILQVHWGNHWYFSPFMEVSLTDTFFLSPNASQFHGHSLQIPLISLWLIP